MTIKKMLVSAGLVLLGVLWWYVVIIVPNAPIQVNEPVATVPVARVPQIQAQSPAVRTAGDAPTASDRKSSVAAENVSSVLIMFQNMLYWIIGIVVFVFVSVIGIYTAVWVSRSRNKQKAGSGSAQPTPPTTPRTPASTARVLWPFPVGGLVLAAIIYHFYLELPWMAYVKWWVPVFAAIAIGVWYLAWRQPWTMSTGTVAPSTRTAAQTRTGWKWFGIVAAVVVVGALVLPNTDIGSRFNEVRTTQSSEQAKTGSGNVVGQKAQTVPGTTFGVEIQKALGLPQVPVQTILFVAVIAALGLGGWIQFLVIRKNKKPGTAWMLIMGLMFASFLAWWFMTTGDQGGNTDMMHIIKTLWMKIGPTWQHNLTIFAGALLFCRIFVASWMLTVVCASGLSVIIIVLSFLTSLS